MRVKTWNLYVEEEHFTHLVRFHSSSILFVWLVAIAVRDFSVPYMSEDIFMYASSFTCINVSDYLYLFQSVFDWLFCFWFLTFNFLSPDMYQCNLFHQCTCIIFVLTIYLPLQNQLRSPIFLIFPEYTALSIVFYSLPKEIGNKKNGFEAYDFKSG